MDSKSIENLNDILLILFRIIQKYSKGIILTFENLHLLMQEYI